MALFDFYMFSHFNLGQKEKKCSNGKDDAGEKVKKEKIYDEK